MKKVVNIVLFGNNIVVSMDREEADVCEWSIKGDEKKSRLREMLVCSLKNEGGGH